MSAAILIWKQSRYFGSIQQSGNGDVLEVI